MGRRGPMMRAMIGNTRVPGMGFDSVGNKVRLFGNEVVTKNAAYTARKVGETFLALVVENIEQETFSSEYPGLSDKTVEMKSDLATSGEILEKNVEKPWVETGTFVEKGLGFFDEQGSKIEKKDIIKWLMKKQEKN